jgi:hypothetical protein
MTSGNAGGHSRYLCFHHQTTTRAATEADKTWTRYALGNHTR